MKSNSMIRKQVDRLGRPSINMLNSEIERLERNELFRRLICYLLTCIIAIAAIIIIITNLFLTVLMVEGSSMNPLLKNNELVIVKECNNPQRNDIIAFYQNNKLFIKRVIAIADDVVEINTDGVVSLNGKLLDEPYVTKQSLGNSDIEFPHLIPPGSVFVLGDNRAISSDSRDSKLGTISSEQIVGKVTLSIWPISQIGKSF